MIAGNPIPSKYPRRHYLGHEVTFGQLRIHRRPKTDVRHPARRRPGLVREIVVDRGPVPLGSHRHHADRFHPPARGVPQRAAGRRSAKQFSPAASSLATAARQPWSPKPKSLPVLGGSVNSFSVSAVNHPMSSVTSRRVHCAASMRNVFHAGWFPGIRPAHSTRVTPAADFTAFSTLWKYFIPKFGSACVVARIVGPNRCPAFVTSAALSPSISTAVEITSTQQACHLGHYQAQSQSPDRRRGTGAFPAAAPSPGGRAESPRPAADRTG